MTTVAKPPPPMTLADVSAEAVAMPARVMTYGVDGIGKTTFWSQAPKPIFIPTEDGATRIEVAKFPLCETWDSLLECLRVLCREEHDYQTAVVDSADWAQALAVKFVTDRDFKGNPVDFQDYGRGYRPLIAEWTKFLSALDFLRRTRHMEIALIAHAVASDFKNPEGNDWKIWKSNLHDSEKCSIWAKTKEWVDILLFMNWRVAVRDIEGATKDKAGKGKGVMVQGDTARMCYAGPSAAYCTKVRAGWALPNEFPLSQAEFRNHLNGKES